MFLEKTASVIRIEFNMWRLKKRRNSLPSQIKETRENFIRIEEKLRYNP